MQQSQGQNVSISPPTDPPVMCERIEALPICESMPWNYTLFPNLRGHTTQVEANAELEQFRQLIEVGCSGVIVHFLCAIYAPFCTDDHPLRVLRPCRRLCQHVREDCEPIFNQRAGGLPWPDHLNCDIYDNSNLCFGPGMELLPELTIPPTLVTPTGMKLIDSAFVIICGMIHSDYCFEFLFSVAWPDTPLYRQCRHMYTEQLVHDPVCSPYPGGVMELECTVEVPRNASGISIGWFLDCMELTNDSHITVLSQDQYTDTIRRIRSQLTISGITDDYAGEYTCNILGDEEYIPSDLFTLRDSSYYEVDGPLAPCNDGNVFANIEETPQKCADITENRTIPMSLSCAEPAATTSHYTPMTSTPVVQTTPSPSLPISLPPSTSSLLHIFPHTSTSSLPHIFPHTTNSHDTSMTSTPVVQTTPSPSLPISLPPSTSSLPHIFPHTSTSSLPHIFPHTTTSHDTSMTSTPVASLPPHSLTSSTLPSLTPNVPMVTDPQEDPTSYRIWLYVVTAVGAVFLVIIIVLVLGFVWLCLRQSRSGTMDQHTLKREALLICDHSCSKQLVYCSNKF